MQNRRIILTGLLAFGLAIAGCSGDDTDNGGNGNGMEPDVAEDTDTPDDVGPDSTPDDTEGDSSGGFEVVDCTTVSADTTVSVVDNEFNPEQTTIDTGQVVQWNFNASGHTVTSGGECGMTDGKFNSGPGLSSDGDTFCVRFNTEGTHPYHCTPHCSIGMTGSVTVNAP